MSNPSTVWAQLSLPASPVGAIPFVFTDGVTIMVDPTNFKYTQAADTLLGTSSYLAYQLTIANGIRVSYADTTATPGAATINKIAGRVRFAAAASALVVTNSNVFATSIIIPVIEGAFDATATRVQVSAQANGSFTLTLNAAATAPLTVSFVIINVY